MWKENGEREGKTASPGGDRKHTHTQRRAVDLERVLIYRLLMALLTGRFDC